MLWQTGFSMHRKELRWASRQSGDYWPISRLKALEILYLRFDEVCGSSVQYDYEENRMALTSRLKDI